jgi:nucleotide-binding universal stress UspA family protein
MYQRILVPVDGSATSGKGLAEAIALARLTGGQLRLLHLVDELPFVMGSQGYVALTADVLGLLRQAGVDVLARAQAQVVAAGVACDTLLIDTYGERLADRVGDAVRDWQADLVVLGTHGRRGVGRMLLGSDAEQVLRTATVPVLLVRAPEEGAAG